MADERVVQEVRPGHPRDVPSPGREPEGVVVERQVRRIREGPRTRSVGADPPAVRRPVDAVVPDHAPAGLEDPRELRVADGIVLEHVPRALVDVVVDAEHLRPRHRVVLDDAMEEAARDDRARQGRGPARARGCDPLGVVVHVQPLRELHVQRRGR